MKISTLEATPKLTIDLERLEKKLDGMQRACQAAKVELWPHIKTHKCVTIARRQLALGAAGLTCAKLSEAEAMLPSGVRRIFLAHSLATPLAIKRAAALQQNLEQLILAVTSLPHARALAALVKESNLSFPVAIAVDSGLGREGLRTLEEAAEMAALLRQNSFLRPVSIYTHEGHAVGVVPEKLPEFIEQAHAHLMKFRSVLGELPLWPGSSIGAKSFLGKEEVKAIRPGAYVFGDLYLAQITKSCRLNEVSLSVRSTVVDRPTRELALIDAGSKTFSSDHLPNGIYAASVDGRELTVFRVNEEHGYVTGPEVDSLRIGESIHWIPAHVCPAVNLAREFIVISPDGSHEIWPIEASGCNY